MAGERVCLIGSRPSGMAFLYHLEKLRQEGKTVPEVVCYEKAADWGGLWNYDWRTGMKKKDTKILDLSWGIRLGVHTHNLGKVFWFIIE